MRKILHDESKYGTREAAIRHTNTFPSIEEGFKKYIANYGMPSKQGRIDLDWMMTMLQFGADATNIRSTYIASKSVWWPASFLNQLWGGKEQGTKHVPFNDPNETRMILLIESGKVKHFSDLWDERFLQELEQQLKRDCCCK